MQRIWFLVLAAVLLASCGAPQPSGVATPASPRGTPSAGQNEKVTISFAVWEYERSIYQPLVERFMSEHPDINVVLVSLDDVMMLIPAVTNLPVRSTSCAGLFRLPILLLHSQ